MLDYIEDIINTMNVENMSYEEFARDDNNLKLITIV